MSIIRRVPWLSLTLALLTYCSLGWVVSRASVSPMVWLGIAIGVLLLVGIVTRPWMQLANYSSTVFKSNTRTFVITVLGAFSLFLMISWFRLFLDSLVVVAATILVRIDFQAAGFRQLDAFGIMSFISLFGLSLGVLINRLM